MTVQIVIAGHDFAISSHCIITVQRVIAGHDFAVSSHCITVQIVIAEHDLLYPVIVL